MASNKPTPQEVLCDEILTDARRESEEILLHARQEAAALLAKATDESQKARREELDAARAAAARCRELILSTIPVETGRRRSGRIEALLQSIHDEALRQLPACDRSHYREIIILLAADAVSRMAGETFVVKLAPADRVALGEELAGEIMRRAGRPSLSIRISDEPAITEGGVIIEDAEGRQIWDNRFEARLERLWPELRRQIAIQTGLVSGSKTAEGNT